MEKKKEFVINAFYYGIISFLAIIILYFLYRYCLLIIVSLLASSLIRPLFINIQRFFHIKSKFIKYIVAIFCVVMCYVMIVLFLGITLYVLVQTFYYLPDCIYDIYQQLLTHRYLISFTHHFYTTIDVFLNHILSLVINFIWQMLFNLPSVLTYSFFHLILTVLFIVHDHHIYNGKYIGILYDIYTSIQNILKVLLKTYFFLFMITLGCLWLGFTVMRLDNSFIIAFLIALFDFFPILGLDMIMIPWIVVSVLLNKSFIALQLLILYLFIVTLRNILEPQLLSKQVKISILPMFVIMFIMMKVFGFLAMMISPFLLMVFKDLYDHKKLKNMIES